MKKLSISFLLLAALVALTKAEEEQPENRNFVSRKNPDDNTLTKQITLDFIWSIDNFSQVSQRPTGEYIMSPYFSTKNAPDIKWFILYYPNGYTDDTSDYMAAFLGYESDTTKKLQITPSISLEDVEFRHEMHMTTSVMKPTTMSVSRPIGFDQFVRKEWFNRREYSMVRNDVLKLSVYIDAQVQTHPFKQLNSRFTWRIKYYRSMNSWPTGEFVQSPYYLTSEDPKVRWSLRIYPNGRSADSTDFAVFLAYDWIDERLVKDVKISLNCELLNGQSYVKHNASTDGYVNAGPSKGVGIDNYITLTKLNEIHDLLLSSISLKFRVTFDARFRLSTE